MNVTELQLIVMCTVTLLRKGCIFVSRVIKKHAKSICNQLMSKLKENSLA